VRLALQYAELVRLNFRMYRTFVVFVGVINVAFAVGLVIGVGYLIPNVTDETAAFLVTGAATQMIVTVGVVALPQNLAQAKQEGLLEYLFSLPISREAYLLSLVTFTLAQAVPAIAFAVALGAWRYDFALDVSPLILLVIPLGVLSLAGVGVGMAILSPHMQVTNIATQLIIFYVLFFAPVLLPREQLPQFLQWVATALPPTYVADGVRGTLTDLPGTNTWRALGMMAAFGCGSLGITVMSVRRRG
jgi:ABC-2 type transport system permease protein